MKKQITSFIVGISLIAPSFSAMAADWNPPTREQQEMMINTSASLIKVATGVDVHDLPVIGGLFPKSDSVDYQRIAQDVSRIVNEAFVEDNIFNQDAALGAEVQSLKLYVDLGMNDTGRLFDSLRRLDKIMDRVIEPDLRLRAAGYYASAAQTYLNTLGLLKATDQSNAAVTQELWTTLRSFRATISPLALELRQMQEKDIAPQIVTNCEVKSGEGIRFIDLRTNKEYIYKTGDVWGQCTNARNNMIHDAASNTLYLEKLAGTWKEAEAALLGGDAGLFSFRKLVDPATQQALGVTDSAMAAVITKYDTYTDPKFFGQLDKKICNVISAAIQDSQLEGKFPLYNEKKDQLMGLVNCPLH